MEHDFKGTAVRAKQRCQLSLKGVHRLAHRRRVRENGLKLAAHNRADPDIVRLFSFLHDPWDPEHGPRAAEFTESLRANRAT